MIKKQGKSKKEKSKEHTKKEKQEENTELRDKPTT